MKPRSFLDLERSELVQWCAVRGLETWRADQVLEWVYQKAVFNPEAMTNLAKPLRAELAEAFAFSPLKQLAEACDRDDGTRKWLFELDDGKQIEAVAIPDDEGGLTFCISSQAGCGLKCAFCATGKMGFRRNLTVGEITAQVLHATAAVGRPAHIVFMGMGEPFHNYDAVLGALRRLTGPKLFNLGQRRITVSTAGMVPEIYRFAREGMQVNLAISLGGSTDAKRAELIPLGAVYNLERLLRAADFFADATKRRVSYEYVLLRDVTDSRHDAERLVELFRKRQAHVNLILWNKVPGLPFESPSRATAAKFRAVLEAAGVPCTLRLPKGRSIAAACGQLAVEHKSATRGVDKTALEEV